MSIALKRITSKKELEIIGELYISAFCAEERREFTQLQELLLHPHCVINQIIFRDAIAGFCIYWQFDSFLFLEHFAIEPELRGQKIGEQVLILLKEMHQKPIILEVEPATDVNSVRRIKFYERNGYYLLPVKYRQPSYDGIKPSLDLLLMSNMAEIADTIVKRYISDIHKEVYGVKS